MTREATDQRTPLKRNLPTTLWLSFFQVFLLIMPIAVPFFESRGLSMQQIFTLQAIFSLAVLLLEVPSGVIADLLGRRGTLIWGAVFCGLGNSVLLFAHDFWSLVAFEVLLAVSSSLVSGADIAMVYDSELSLGRSAERQSEVVGKLYASRTLAESLSAALLSILLVWCTIDAVLLVQMLISWLPLVFALSLVEPPRQTPATELRGPLPLATAARHLWEHSAVLRFCFLALCVWSLTTFNAVWLLQKLWGDFGLELLHFGYLWGGLSFACALSGRYANRIERRLGTGATLLLIGVLPVVGYLGLDRFGLMGSLVAGAGFFVARGIGLVILRDALNRRTPSSYRATANSLASFGFRAAFVLTGPFVGYAFDLWGMRTVLLLLAGISLLIGLLVLLPLALAVRQHRPVAAAADAVAMTEPAAAAEPAAIAEPARRPVVRRPR
ncbi:MAG: MFS transporter [Pseudomonadota bacterium]